jgi:hypothetical protein
VCGECEERKWKREIFNNKRKRFPYDLLLTLPSFIFYNNMCWPKNSPKMCMKRKKIARGKQEEGNEFYAKIFQRIVFYTFLHFEYVMRSHTHVNHKYFNESYRDSHFFLLSHYTLIYRRKMSCDSGATSNDSRKEFF